MQENQNALLGTSLKFPLVVDITGKAELVSGQENIQQAIKDRILSIKNIRFFLGQYGSQVNKLNGIPNQGMASNLADYYIKEALFEEQRIIVRQVTVSFIDNQMKLDISYKLRNSNIIGNTEVIV